MLCVISYVHIMGAYHCVHIICSHMPYAHHIMCSNSVHILYLFTHHISPTRYCIQYTVVTREVRSSRPTRMMIQSTRIRSLSKLLSQFDQVLNRIYPLPLPRSLMHLPLHVVMRSLVMKSNQH